MKHVLLEKKNCNSCEQINKKSSFMGWGRAPRGGDGVRIFSPSCKTGKDGAKQNHAGRGRKPHPLAPPRPIVIPTQEGPNTFLSQHAKVTYVVLHRL